MRTLALRNERTGSVIAHRVARADSFLSRSLGLLPRAAVGADEGLWINPCSSVHTMGMRATIDLYFLDRDDRVVRIVEGAPPHKLVYACKGARSVVELGTGAVRDVRVGDRLALD